MLANITIKMPDSVPPAVSKAFAAILPATIALYVIAIINYIVGRVADGQLIIDLVQKYIAEPFLGLSQGLGAVLIVTVFVQVFWFFGIHGPNVLAPVLEGIWGQAQLINIDIFQKVITENWYTSRVRCNRRWKSLYVGPRIVRCFCMVWRIRRNDRLTDSYLDFL